MLSSYLDRYTAFLPHFHFRRFERDMETKCKIKFMGIEKEATVGSNELYLLLDRKR